MEKLISAPGVNHVYITIFRLHSSFCIERFKIFNREILSPRILPGCLFLNLVRVYYSDFCLRLVSLSYLVASVSTTCPLRPADRAAGDRLEVLEAGARAAGSRPLA